jgi:hypothetical protein
MLPDNYLDGFSPIFYCSEQLVVFKGSLALIVFGRTEMKRVIYAAYG